MNVSLLSSQYMPGLKGMTAMLSHPEGGGQSRDQQTKPKVQVLNPGDS